MYYVYELRYNNKPFYVGFTGYLRGRYVMHIYDCLSRGYSLIRYMIHTCNLYPEMIVIYCSEYKMDCLDYEDRRIKQLINEGCKILNYEKISLPNVRLKHQRIPKLILSDIISQQSKFALDYEQQNNN